LLSASENVQAAAPPNPRFGVVSAFEAPEAAAQLRVGWSRALFRWPDLERQGPHDWNPYYLPDGIVNQELAQGRELVGILLGVPDWANDNQGARVPPKGLYLAYDDPGNLWGQFVTRIASRYRGRIRHWVIWNEPDVWDLSHPGATWVGSVEDYYQLVKVAYLAAKAANPQSVIHLAGMTYWWDYGYGRPLYFQRLLDVMLKDPTAPTHNYYFDVATLHLYFNVPQLYDIVRLYRKLLDERGLRHPIWINETNAPPFDDPTAPVSRTKFPVTMEQQAAYLIQASAMALAAGAERVEVYKMRDEPDLPPEAEPYGLVRRDGSLRPAFAAYRVVTTYLTDVQSASLKKLGPVNLVVLNQRNRTTTVVWNTSVQARTASIPALADRAQLVDKQGRVQSIEAQQGRYALKLDAAQCPDPKQCAIGGSPVVLVESASSQATRTPTPTRTLATPTASRPPTATPTATFTPRPVASPVPTKQSAGATRTKTPEPSTGESSWPFLENLPPCLGPALLLVGTAKRLRQRRRGC